MLCTKVSHKEAIEKIISFLFLLVFYLLWSLYIVTLFKHIFGLSCLALSHLLCFVSVIVVSCCLLGCSSLSFSYIWSFINSLSHRSTLLSIASTVPLTVQAPVIYVFTGTMNNEKHLLGVMFFIVHDQG